MERLLQQEDHRDADHGSGRVAPPHGDRRPEQDREKRSAAFLRRRAQRACHRCRDFELEVVAEEILLAGPWLLEREAELMVVAQGSPPEVQLLFQDAALEPFSVIGSTKR